MPVITSQKAVRVTAAQPHAYGIRNNMPIPAVEDLDVSIEKIPHITNPAVTAADNIEAYFRGENTFV